MKIKYTLLFEMCKFGSPTYQFYSLQLKKIHPFPDFHEVFEVFSSSTAQLGCFTFHIKLSHGPKGIEAKEDTL